MKICPTVKNTRGPGCSKLGLIEKRPLKNYQRLRNSKLPNLVTLHRDCGLTRTFLRSSFFSSMSFMSKTISRFLTRSGIPAASDAAAGRSPLRRGLNRNFTFLTLSIKGLEYDNSTTFMLCKFHWT